MLSNGAKGIFEFLNLLTGFHAWKGTESHLYCAVFRHDIYGRTSTDLPDVHDSVRFGQIRFKASGLAPMVREFFELRDDPLSYQDGVYA